MKEKLFKFKPVGIIESHSPFACIFEVEEKRLIRLKYVENIFPIHAIDFCLKEVGNFLSEKTKGRSVCLKKK